MLLITPIVENKYKLIKSTTVYLRNLINPGTAAGSNSNFVKRITIEELNNILEFTAF